MDKLEQIQKLHRLLKSRRTPIPRAELEERLGLKRATTTRLLSFCRDRLQMPIAFDPECKGYCYVEAERDNFELPGLWFSAAELHALMASHRLLAAVQPGVLQPFIEPLQQRIEELLRRTPAGNQAVFERIRILPLANRVVKLEHFQQITDALVTRKRLRVLYSSRSKGEITERWLSPQRLLYYRDNWYLDAWCHLRQDIRTFALDCIEVLAATGRARNVDDKQLDAHLSSSYGLFAGNPRHQAVIHFSNSSARWVAAEQWHPAQQSRHLVDGRWELIVPYNDPTELIMDILRYGPDAEVVAPPELREQVMEKLSQSLRTYRKLKKV